MPSPNYQALIDADTWAFIERTQACYPPDAVDSSVERQRQLYDAMCGVFRSEHPPGVSVCDLDGGGVPLRVYSVGEVAEALVLYLHGGGFVVGGLDSHDDVCAELCARSGYTVVAVDYRLCPEHAHPAAFDDAMQALRWVVERCALPVLVCGDSAGGNLAAALAHSSRGSPCAPKGQLLIYPGLGGDVRSGSYVQHGEAPMLSTREVLYYDQLRLGAAQPEQFYADPRYAPLRDTDFSGLPPTLVFGAECDPLCDDGDVYCQALRLAGVQAEFVLERGLVHGYLRARHSVARAAASFDRICAGLQSLGAGQSLSAGRT